MRPPPGPPADVRPPHPGAGRRFGPAAGPPELPFGLARFLVQALDINKDGKIDEKEIAEAAKALRGLDLSGGRMPGPRSAPGGPRPPEAGVNPK
jgi:hypothetical protein